MNDKISGFMASAECSKIFKDFYGTNPLIIRKQKKRYAEAAKRFIKLFGRKDYSVFNTPGRAEIIGNHTDHNLGKVVAGSITLDAIAIASANGLDKIRIHSENYKKTFVVELENLRPAENEKGTTESLIRGVAAGFRKHGYKTGGFDAFIDSEVLPGSGLSSSACFEVLAGTIMNGLFNDMNVPAVEAAKIGQFAENNYMMKPSGLMDQLACACGGIIKIDFRKRENPDIRSISFNPADSGYSLAVVDSKGSHENLTPCYASVPAEMKEVSRFFKKDVLRKIDYRKFKKNIRKLSAKLGDRAVLRAMHYYEENLRVDELMEAMGKESIENFLSVINRSGTSSCILLQNCSVPENSREQKLLLALAMTGLFINEAGSGACRVHGGGFAGTILAFIPTTKMKSYRKIIKPVFGDDALKILNIRNTGTVKLI